MHVHHETRKSPIGDFYVILYLHCYILYSTVYVLTVLRIHKSQLGWELWSICNLRKAMFTKTCMHVSLHIYL